MWKLRQPPLTAEADHTLGEASFPSLGCGRSHPYPGPALKSWLHFQTEEEVARYTQSGLALRGGSGIYYLQRDAGREQSVELSRNYRPVNFPNPEDSLCTPEPYPQSSQVSHSSRGRESLFPSSQPKGKGRGRQICLVSIDSTQRLTAKVPMTHHTSPRLNVIMRAGQAVRTGFQISVTASYLKIRT